MSCCFGVALLLPCCLALSTQESRVSACCQCKDEGRELWRIEAAELLWQSYETELGMVLEEASLRGVWLGRGLGFTGSVLGKQDGWCEEQRWESPKLA